ncbi:MAG: hypothetical protein NVS4B7_10060 [Ktedonobacteraceae bacterium]
MQKKSALWLMLILSALLAIVTACGSNMPLSTSSATATVPAAENIYVLDGYTPLGSASTGQQIVAFHPGSANPRTIVSLPEGLTSRDHKTLYTASAQNGKATIKVINTESGTTIRSIVIDGTYTTSGQNFNNAVLSFDGHWLALREMGQTGNETTIALVDTRAGKLVQTIRLGGMFDLDAVNPDGSRIYLLERLNDAAGHYYVRLYDVVEKHLYENRIADKSEINDPRMVGTALARQMSSDGRFAYTLYIDAFHNIAFVHILPLTDQLYVARCLELPVGKLADLLRYYTLTLTSDGSTLYAANGALGIVSKISLDTSVIFNDQVDATLHFTAGDVNMNGNDRTRVLHKGAVLSADDSRLYFVGMHGVMAIGTSDLSASSLVQYQTSQSFTSIALSADGRTLYAVDPANGITLLNASNGQAQQVMQGPLHSPWGIEWITN